MEEQRASIFIDVGHRCTKVRRRASVVGRSVVSEAVVRCVRWRRKIRSHIDGVAGWTRHQHVLVQGVHVLRVIDCQRATSYIFTRQSNRAGQPPLRYALNPWV